MVSHLYEKIERKQEDENQAVDFMVLQNFMLL